MRVKILVVDDEPDVEMLIKLKFRNKISSGQLSFCFAGNGVQALEALEKEQEINLVFTDINMPVMDGLTLLSKIKTNKTLPKVVVISAYGDLKNIRSAMNLGAFDFVTKPIDFEDLEITLNKAINEINRLNQTIELKSQHEILRIEKEQLIVNQNQILEKKVEERTLELQKEKSKSDELLLNILPPETANELKSLGYSKPKHYNQVTVLFTDFKNFTQISEKLSADELVEEINFCYSNFDRIISKYGIEKIKTIGDSYMCAGGLDNFGNESVINAIHAAIEIRDFMLVENKKRSEKNEFYFDIRIGLHTGPVIAGIVGIKKFAYDIWGNTVNIASRMESAGEPGKINVSGETYEVIKNNFSCEYRGKVMAKNKGDIDMYFVEKLS
ncbi:MAG TPA: adenylate/guanylate cyclase domain-containing protein [Bacteroidia bacterium]|nr:adenylate/guanylate cyclase domain-containing protein [Bacteroidia bacterium]